MDRIWKAQTFIAAFCAAIVSAGCGGGSGQGKPSTATVASIAPDVLMYGKSVTFTVTGTNLDLGISLTAPGCDKIGEAAGGTATQRKYSCTPIVTGTFPVTVKAADGTTLASIAPTVPLPRVTMRTTMGDMLLELYPNNAPITVNNFLQYVNDKFYDNLIFHRVIQGFMIQGGGYTASLQQVPTRDPIKLEAPNGLSNVQYTIAMARQDSGQPEVQESDLNSATSQFFINSVDNLYLDTYRGGYAVFGKVISGMTVVSEDISTVPTQTIGGMANVPDPVDSVVIISMTQTQ